MSERFSLGSRLESFRFALRGLGWMLSTQHNARIHALASICVVVAGLALGVSRTEWIALALAMGGVWMAEAMNSAIEALCDVASPDPNPLVGRAKDVAAAAVLLAALAAVCVGLLVFVPRIGCALAA